MEDTPEDAVKVVDKNFSELLYPRDTLTSATERVNARLEEDARSRKISRATECAEADRCGAFISSVCVPGMPCFGLGVSERQKALRDVRDMLLLEHRKELGMLVGGTEIERAVTRIFSQFIKLVEAMR